METRMFLSVCVMAIVTYLIRVLPIVLFQKKIKNRFIQSFLTYVPYAVLSAMTFPAILYSFDVNVIRLSTVLGTLVALGLSYRKASLIQVALGAVLTVYGCESILQCFF